MYALTIVILMSWLALQMVSLSDSYNYVASLYRDQADDIQFENLNADIDRYLNRYGDTPTSLSALQTDDLFIHSRSHDEHWIVYRKQSGLTDDRFTYERTGFAFIDRTRFKSMGDPAQFFNAQWNRCASADFSSATSWCSDTEVPWRRIESRETISQEYLKQHLRLNRTVQKIYRHYELNGTLVNTKASGTLSDGDYGTLAALTSVSSASTCSGVIDWGGIPMDCSDLYSVWGTAVSYNYLSSSDGFLVVSTPFTDKSGNKLYIIRRIIGV